MYNQSYEEYMRSILGYPTDYRNTYETMNTYNPNYDIYSNTRDASYRNDSELEECYPEIYRLVYPMVTKACRENREPITKELVDRMTNEIYQAIEVDNDVQISINLQNNVRSQSTQNTNTSHRSSNDVKTNEDRSTENRQRRPINRTLNDLIRILILRELLGRPGNFPFPRPRPRPPRPGFPGGMGPGRPPFMPRDFEDDYMF